MATLVLTVIGDDRAGLVNSLAEVVAEHGGNWERSEMAELAGKFAGIVLVTVADQQAQTLADALAPLPGLAVHVEPAQSATAHDAPRQTLHLLGNDHPGIVQEVTRVLSKHSVTIDALTTRTMEAPMAGGTLFEADATVRFTGADQAAVRADLESLAGELMVDLTFAE